ncbi:hypothetical protein HGRIS_002409 [Hohenbuehelia grisea]|uniref:Multifunctional tryptophan biosynthesis protein n=1 Tax=Hohenbuehelia grisea TaxID=104357 RepID=A0ABR3JKD9_9AGAR
MSPTTTLPQQLNRQLDVLLIDNFDSFTWNLYQQLCLLGADVTVIRNDAISPSVFPLLKLNSLIISPGPGHPKTDSGISKAAIEYFQGKVPILGVCMGLECLVDLHGGEIGYAGEIMHGKVSRVRHDNRGCFKGIPQGIKSIRYHSLSASLTTLPAHIAITSTTEESGVIMGVRHRKYTLEAVQYHPESILSEGGDDLIRNFLSLRGGYWEQNPHSMVLDSNLPPFDLKSLPPAVASDPETKQKVPSILEKIYAQRLEDVAKAQSTPGTTYSDLETLLSLNIAPPLIPFLPRLGQNQSHPSLIAEIKRASPSKGPINTTVSPAAQALTYASAGAHTISVLTEPKWFLGSLQDMLHARQSVAHLPNRPAILRKDFILSRYQVLESRLWGADTLLLIVSMLPEALLRDLYAFSVQLGMEPLVEVNNEREMELALSLPAKVIGVNNRNLHSFEVDMGTTSRLTDMVKGKDVVLCALSGIATPDDVNKYAAEGVGAVLIGESLMRANDTTAFIRRLLSIPESPSAPQQGWDAHPPLVKVCGVQSAEEALGCAEAGADMLGIVFVPSSKRTIGLEMAREISNAIHSLPSSLPPATTSTELAHAHAPWFTAHASRWSNYTRRPLLVGVFQNATLESILQTVSHVQLDMVQLHGSEPTELAHHIPVPVIRAFHVGKGAGLDGITRGGAHQYVLLDSVREDGSGVSGGSGKVVDWDLARRVVDAGEIVLDGGISYRAGSQPVSGDASEISSDATPSDSASPKFPMPIILAGGLNESNVADAIERVRPWAVDVSGGVELGTGPQKDMDKVKAFISKAKTRSLPVVEQSAGEAAEDEA